MGSVDSGIRVEGLVTHLGRRPVLRGATCRFAPGITALVGRNGAGKTTLLRTVAGLITPKSGSITLDGKTVAARTARRAFRSRLGWMPQDLVFPQGITVAESIEYAAWMRGHRRRDLPRLRDLTMEETAMTGLARRRATELSGGQVRRLGLASALAGSPDVLLLDEPTVGLDPVQRASMLALIRGLADSRIVVLSTHLVEDILSTADHLVTMAEGQVTHSGALEDILPGGREAREAAAAINLLLGGPGADAA